MARFVVGLVSLFWSISPAAVSAAKKPIQVYVYPTFVSVSGVRVKGRVLKKSRFVRTDKKSKSKMWMFMRSLRRFTRRSPGLTPVKITWNGKSRFVTSDAKGYFSATFAHPAKTRLLPASRPTTRLATSRPTATLHWPKKNGTLPRGVSRVQVSTIFQNSSYQNASSQSFAVSPLSGRGLSVVSDIDDTLIASHISSKVKMLKTALLKDFRNVKVFPDALRFLRTVLTSPGGKGGGTLHYVTGSPVNLYDRLQALFRLRDFPAGSMHMKYLSGANKTSASDHQGHKLRNLRLLLKAYPKRRFLLLGDSTEQDAPIYRQARREFPKQVAGIFIHNVTNVNSTMPRFKGVTLFRDYKQALRLIRRLKLLTPTR